MSTTAGPRAGRAGGLRGHTGAPAPWSAAALARPALLPWGDGYLPTAPRLWLEWAAERVAGALARLANRPVTLRTGSEPPPPGLAPAYGVEIATKRGTPILVALDSGAARAVIDALAGEAAGLRGSGPPTDAERGVLDFAALAAIDEACRVGGEPLSGLVVRRLWTEADEGWWPANASGVSALHLSIGARAGLCLVSTQEPLAKALALPPCGEAAVVDTVEVGLALPPVAVTPGEWESLAPGDTLLAGVSVAARESMRGSLATSNGWSICPAQVILDTSTLTTVRCGPPDISVGPGPVDRAGNVLIVAMIGGVDLPLSALASLKDGDSVDLPKSADAPARLFRGGRCAARGELVAIDGEIGVRILELCSGGGGVR